MPPLETAADMTAAIAAVLQATAAGELSPTEANELAGLIEAQRKVIETADLVERIERLEQLLEKR